MTQDFGRRTWVVQVRHRPTNIVADLRVNADDDAGARSAALAVMASRGMGQDCRTSIPEELASGLPPRSG